MENNLAILEIKNKSFKILVGYLYEGKVNVLYKNSFKLSVPIKDADIYDIGSLTNDLKQILKIDDQEHKLKLSISEVVVVFPAYGLEVYNCYKSTSTVANDSKIEEIDIKNVISLVKKEEVPQNNTIIDIIPEEFIINNERVFFKPPLGEYSSLLGIKATVYTLPDKMINDFRKAIKEAGLTIKKEVISPVTVSYYLENKNFKYNSYILVDFSAKTTTISVIMKNKVVKSTYFSIGSDDLTEKIAKEFIINRNEAERLKKVYGNDLKKSNFNPPIISIATEDRVRQFKGEDLNNVVNQFLKQWTSLLINALNTMLQSRDDFIEKFPIILTGNGSLLNGLKDYILRFLPKNTLEILTSDVIGAEEPGFINCVSAVCFSSIYKGSLMDYNYFVSDVKRIDKKHNDVDDLDDTL